MRFADERGRKEAADGKLEEEREHFSKPQVTSFCKRRLQLLVSEAAFELGKAAG